MKSGSWRFKALALVFGGVAIAAAASLGPKLAFSYSKQQALKDLEASPASCPRLAPDVCRIPVADGHGEMCVANFCGWSFSLPKADYKLSTDALDPGIVFVGKKLSVKVDGVRDRRPDFKSGFVPSNPSVKKYFREVEPYGMLVDAFGSTPADVERAQTPAELQKSLYLLMLRAALQTHGAEDLWQRIEIGSRRGFLSGNETSPVLVATIYLEQTKEFAEVVITPKPGATWEDIFACLGALDIQKAAESECLWPVSSGSSFPGLPPRCPR